jgi:hypothetical protein
MPGEMIALKNIEIHGNMLREIELKFIVFYFYYISNISLLYFYFISTISLLYFYLAHPPFPS